MASINTLTQHPAPRGSYPSDCDCVHHHRTDVLPIVDGGLSLVVAFVHLGRLHWLLHLPVLVLLLRLSLTHDGLPAGNVLLRVRT